MYLETVLSKLPDINEEQKVTISYSGGFDSTVLLYLLVLKYGNEKVKCVSFDYGQRNSTELEMVVKNCELLEVSNHKVDMSFLGEMLKDSSALLSTSEATPKNANEAKADIRQTTYVPNRNMIFMSIVGAYAEANNSPYIFMANTRTDTAWDGSSDFVTTLNNLFLLNTIDGVQVISPFIRFTKTHEAMLAKELGNKFKRNILEFVWSCYNEITESGKECGHCKPCKEKIIAYIESGYSEEEILNTFDLTKDELASLKGIYRYVF